MHAGVLWLARNKEFFTTSGVVLASILFLGFFKESPALQPEIQSFIVMLAVFLVIPLLYCKIVLEQPLSFLGFQRGNPWAGVGGSIFALGLAIAGLFVLWNFTPLLRDYQLPVIVEEKFLFFVLYEIFFNGFFLFLLEVFFRGMLLFVWLRDFGIWGAFLQAGVFAGILYLSNDITAQTIPLVLFAPFSGLIAYQSRSLWYGFWASWIFLLIMDALVLVVR